MTSQQNTVRLVVARTYLYAYVYK